MAKFEAKLCGDLRCERCQLSGSAWCIVDSSSHSDSITASCKLCALTLTECVFTRHITIRMTASDFLGEGFNTKLSHSSKTSLMNLNTTYQSDSVTPGVAIRDTVSAPNHSDANTEDEADLSSSSAEPDQFPPKFNSGANFLTNAKSTFHWRIGEG